MKKENKKTLMYGLGLAGNATGIIIAVARKSGFWGGVGWFLLGGLCGAAAGYIITSAIPDDKKDQPVT